MDKSNSNQDQLISYSDGINQISSPMNEKIQNGYILIWPVNFT